MNVRDGIYVRDNCDGIETVIEMDKSSELYNIGGDNEKTNISITNIILKELGLNESCIEFVED